MNTQALLTLILRREGWPRVTDHSWDAGKLSKGGVTFTSYNRYLAKRGRQELSRGQFISLGEADARAFFEAEFFVPFAFIDDPGVFAFVTDWAVNAGPDNPTRA
jgi:lysozyme family protein